MESVDFSAPTISHDMDQVLDVIADGLEVDHQHYVEKMKTQDLKVEDQHATISFPPLVDIDPEIAPMSEISLSNHQNDIFQYEAHKVDEVDPDQHEEVLAQFNVPINSEILNDYSTPIRSNYVEIEDIESPTESSISTDSTELEQEDMEIEYIDEIEEVPTDSNEITGFSVPSSTPEETEVLVVPFVNHLEGEEQQPTAFDTESVDDMSTSHDMELVNDVIADGSEFDLQKDFDQSETHDSEVNEVDQELPACYVPESTNIELRQMETEDNDNIEEVPTDSDGTDSSSVSISTTEDQKETRFADNQKDEKELLVCENVLTSPNARLNLLGNPIEDNTEVTLSLSDIEKVITVSDEIVGSSLSSPTQTEQKEMEIPLAGHEEPQESVVLNYASNVVANDESTSSSQLEQVMFDDPVAAHVDLEVKPDFKKTEDVTNKTALYETIEHQNQIRSPSTPQSVDSTVSTQVVTDLTVNIDLDAVWFKNKIAKTATDCDEIPSSTVSIPALTNQDILDDQLAAHVEPHMKPTLENTEDIMNKKITAAYDKVKDQNQSCSLPVVASNDRVQQVDKTEKLRETDADFELDRQDDIDQPKKQSSQMPESNETVQPEEVLVRKSEPVNNQHVVFEENVVVEDNFSTTVKVVDEASNSISKNNLESISILSKDNMKQKKNDNGEELFADTDTSASTAVSSPRPMDQEDPDALPPNRIIKPIVLYLNKHEIAYNLEISYLVATGRIEDAASPEELPAGSSKSTEPVEEDVGECSSSSYTEEIATNVQQEVESPETKNSVQQDKENENSSSCVDPQNMRTAFSVPNVESIISGHFSSHESVIQYQPSVTKRGYSDPELEMSPKIAKIGESSFSQLEQDKSVRVQRIADEITERRDQEKSFSIEHFHQLPKTSENSNQDSHSKQEKGKLIPDQKEFVQQIYVPSDAPAPVANSMKWKNGGEIEVYNGRNDVMQRFLELMGQNSVSEFNRLLSIPQQPITNQTANFANIFPQPQQTAFQVPSTPYHIPTSSNATNLPTNSNAVPLASPSPFGINYMALLLNQMQANLQVQQAQQAPKMVDYTRLLGFLNMKQVQTVPEVKPAFTKPLLEQPSRPVASTSKCSQGTTCSPFGTFDMKLGQTAAKNNPSVYRSTLKRPPTSGSECSSGYSSSSSSSLSPPREKTREANSTLVKKDSARQASEKNDSPVGQKTIHRLPGYPNKDATTFLCYENGNMADCYFYIMNNLHQTHLPDGELERNVFWHYENLLMFIEAKQLIPTGRAYTYSGENEYHLITGPYENLPTQNPAFHSVHQPSMGPPSIKKQKIIQGSDSKQNKSARRGGPAPSGDVSIQVTPLPRNSAKPSKHSVDSIQNAVDAAQIPRYPAQSPHLSGHQYDLTAHSAAMINYLCQVAFNQQYQKH